MEEESPAGRSRRRRRSRATLAAIPAAILAGVLAVAVAVDAQPGQPPSATRHGRPRHHRVAPPLAAQVTVSARASLAAVPRSYLGLSTEYWALPLWAPDMSLLERVVSLIHVRGGGPFILRVGGDSADHSFWDPDSAPMPSWAFTIQPQWLSEAGQLVRADAIKLILDLNLITDSPSAATAWARAAESGLPHGSIVAFEVGNEPDIYSRTDWLAITAGRSLDGHPIDRSLPAAISAKAYVHDFRKYAAALSEVEPGVPVAGPALANPVTHRRWVATLVDGAGHSLGLVTVHRYPYSGCAGRRGTASYATIGRLLSPAASTGMAQALRPVVDAANDAGLALRLTELNSVNCGGRPGVSDSFATALWAPDALFALLRAGVDGVNLHVRADAINAPFALTPGGLQARPLLYGLIFFSRALGPDAQLVKVDATAPRASNLSAWGVRVGSDTLHVVLIDKGRRSVRVALRLPATATATVQRLQAPSAASQNGVTVGGQSLATDGSWQGTATLQTVPHRTDGYAVDLRRQSAALLSVRVSPGALGTPRAVVTDDRRPRAARRAPRAGRSPRR
ncbi:MAG TPA: glycosyl hydrolase family 79 C-terminal domain-containing protein [Solirubrobacteraceae bacterium]|nr:glycosyl hydrolase family 79 C-terminal domain-containing protein [Solirubrobacteraceae bacterium]